MPSSVFSSLGDPVGDGPGRDPARLGVPDLAADAAAELQADLGQLGRLARTGLARDDHDLVLVDRCRELGLPLAHRQFGRIGDDRDDASPRLDALTGRPDLVRELCEGLLASRGVTAATLPGPRAGPAGAGR